MTKENILKPIEQSIRDAARKQGGSRAAFRAVLSVPVMRDYLATYFADDFLDDAVEYQRVGKFPEPAADNLDLDPNRILGYMGNYTHGMSEEEVFATGNVRPQHLYPLSVRELSSAQKKLDEMPVLPLVFTALQAGVAAYLQDVLDVVSPLFAGIDDEEGQFSDEEYALSAIETGILDLQTAAKGESFMHDLVPIIASQLDSQSGFSGDDIRQGLVFAFRRSAFKSYEGKPSTPLVTRCPFSTVVVHLADTVLEKDDRGALTVAVERTEPGALLVFLAERINEIKLSRTQEKSPAPAVPSPV